MVESLSREPEIVPGEATWVWPFSRADITAGLRRRLGDTSLQITSLSSFSIPDQRPSIGRVRGIVVGYEGGAGSAECRLVVKEPRGTTRTGLAGAGRREVGVYRSLAPHLPMKTPTLVAASASGDWLVLEAIPQEKTPEHWEADDYRKALESLAQLHDRFWGLGEDLGTYTWLSRPLEADFDVHLAVAAQSLETIVEKGLPGSLAGAPARIKVLSSLIEQAAAVVAPLREQPSTLLHGDYWPGNIAVTDQSEQIAYDWQQTAVGPGVIDLLTFVNMSGWWFNPLPLAREEMVQIYRSELNDRLGISWDEDGWARLWDHAVMWRFLQEWIDLLAILPDPLLEARAELLDGIWLDPVAHAVDRRLGG
ncbi:MAG TPA: phosphotransferase [Anaerolineales bacterium]|nr:phosphotransferase [Anaerolineales bacterium]